MVNIKKLAGALAATAITFSVGAATAAPASVVDNVKPFGNQQRLNGWAGAPMIGYTVRDLSPSSDPVPHWAIPVVPMFNARAENSAMYRVLADAGVGGAVPPGGSTTGKLYFDVVGDVPNSVVYNDGVRDVLAWVSGPPVGGTRP